MANTVTIRKLHDGDRYAVIHAYLASDGASGELTDQVLVDASTLKGSPTKLTIEKAEWAFKGFSARLEFDATADSPALVLFDGANGDFDGRDFGGIPDPGGQGATGDIVISTTGFSDSGDEGVLLLRVRKD